MAQILQDVFVFVHQILPQAVTLYLSHSLQNTAEWDFAAQLHNGFFPPAGGLSDCSQLIWTMLKRGPLQACPGGEALSPSQDGELLPEIVSQSHLFPRQPLYLRTGTWVVLHVH